MKYGVQYYGTVYNFDKLGMIGHFVILSDRYQLLLH